MNPKTGDILAMATYPDYNLNEPFEPNQKLSKNWDKLSNSEKINSLQKMWRNKAVSDTYEPGSTFKIINAAIALEENIVDVDTKNFLCRATETVSNIPINCWSSTPHGYLSLREALMYSCNPAFIQLGRKIGTSTLYKYYNAFGLFSKTNASVAGESSSIFFEENKVTALNLATMSFGQRFKITPLQLITSVCGIVNNGVLMQPRIVKQVINSDTGAVTNIEPVTVRKIVSEETSAKIKSMLESVVTKGTGTNASVAGYSIGGKTGTSQAIQGQEDTDGYVASFIAVAPASDPELVILVTMYKPKGESHSGGTVAGSVVSNVLSEVLPTLGISSTSSNNSTEKQLTVPNVVNKTLTEAELSLEGSGFTTVKSSNENSNRAVIVEQVPKAGTVLSDGATIALYTSKNTVRTSVTVPNLIGMSYAQAKNALNSKNLNIQSKGSGSKVVSQSVQYGGQSEIASVITVTLGE